MKYSVAMGLKPERIEAMAAAGYKHFEFHFDGVAKMDDDTFETFLSTVKRTGLIAVASNGMFGGDFKLLSGEACYESVRAHSKRGFERARKLGTNIVVLGSGSARAIPEGMTVEEAKDRFTALICDAILPLAEEYDMIIAIEELNHKECNFLNTCGEAMEIVKRVNSPRIKLLVDFFHVSIEGEKYEDIANYRDDIVHVHIASLSNDHKTPTVEHDLDDMKKIADLLDSIGYDAAISVESVIEDFDKDIAKGLKLMNTAFAK